ncbi:MAG: ferritin-like protein [Gammaproteobacteria bacterium]|nr:ferritin-like protein [Gammaproteobacteria bacterium]
MLKIDPKIVAGIESCTSKTDLYPYLQNAIELEHSTIPPYLTAYYSLIPGLNDEIAGLIRSVVIEEMIHMTIAANILVSLGGSPSVNNPDFVPDYPGSLPMGIGGRDFTVHISAFSMDLVINTFMVIEEPEDPIDIGVLRSQEVTYHTIGEFYGALKKKISQLPTSDFGHQERQVLSVFSPEVIFPITDSTTANNAIDIIVKQGEGTSTDPFESAGEPAHFYRFGEIYYGSQLIEDKNGQCKGKKYCYGGNPIPFVSEGVFPMKPDPTSEQFAEGSYGRVLSDNFTEGYSSLLNALHESFNGSPDQIDTAIGLMYQLRFMAQKLMSTPLKEGEISTAGPVYKYQKT